MYYCIIIVKLSLPLQEDSSKDSEHDIDLIEEALRGKVSRASLTSLFAKCGKGKEDLSTPSVLKERYSVGDETLVKEHKIQVCNILWTIPAKAYIKKLHF